jgi:flagellar biosynthesis/type III secretory pathway protein FliH
MAEGFVALDAFLREASPSVIASEVASAGEYGDEAPHVRNEACPCAGAFSEIRRFHAALADALDFALEGLLRDVACDVLARELSLAPADVAAIAARALTRYANESPVRLRAHPEEIGHLAGINVPVVADSGLRRGDVAIDLQCGTIDAGLGARLLCALERAP